MTEKTYRKALDEIIYICEREVPPDLFLRHEYTFIKECLKEIYNIALNATNRNT